MNLLLRHGLACQVLEQLVLCRLGWQVLADSSLPGLAWQAPCCLLRLTVFLRWYGLAGMLICKAGLAGGCCCDCPDCHCVRACTSLAYMAW